MNNTEIRNTIFNFRDKDWRFRKAGPDFKLFRGHSWIRIQLGKTLTITVAPDSNIEQFIDEIPRRKDDLVKSILKARKYIESYAKRVAMLRPITITFNSSNSSGKKTLYLPPASVIRIIDTLESFGVCDFNNDGSNIFSFEKPKPMRGKLIEDTFEVPQLSRLIDPLNPKTVYFTYFATIAQGADDKLSRVYYAEDQYRLANIANSDYPKDRLTALMKRPPKIVTVYKAVTNGTNIEPGDWVALSMSYAKNVEGGSILRKRVPSIDIVWAETDENEFFYAPKDMAR